MKYTISGPFKTRMFGRDFLVKGKITVEQDEIIDEGDINESNDAVYMLRYTKISGETKDYLLKSIEEMSNTHLKCVVCNKGYRNFRVNGIHKLELIKV